MYFCHGPFHALLSKNLICLSPNHSWNDLRRCAVPDAFSFEDSKAHSIVLLMADCMISLHNSELLRQSYSIREKDDLNGNVVSDIPTQRWIGTHDSTEEISSRPTKRIFDQVGRCIIVLHDKVLWCRHPAHVLFVPDRVRAAVR